jgi:small subunit ribosomal protein S20
MANLKSQKKRIKTNERRRVANRSVRSALKTHMRRFEAALQSGDLESARAAMQQAGKELDKAAAIGAIHPNSASNHKSSMAKRLNSGGAAG